MDEIKNKLFKHISLYLITFSNLFIKGLTDVLMSVPGFLASLSLVILSPCYVFTEVRKKQALTIGINGLKTTPKKILIGIFYILLSPVGYPISIFNKKGISIFNKKPKKKIKKKKKEELKEEENYVYKGTPDVV